MATIALARYAFTIASSVFTVSFFNSRKLGIIETIRVNPKNIAKHNSQTFDFLYVLDFESTCWDSKDLNRRPPEIIEFSVVLYSIVDDIIVDEFQQYVMPVESPKLSDFCKQFSGLYTIYLTLSWAVQY